MAQKTNKQLKKLLQNKKAQQSNKVVPMTPRTNAGVAGNPSSAKKKTETSAAELKELLQVIDANDAQGLHHPEVDEVTFMNLLASIKQHESEILPTRYTVTADTSILPDYDEDDQKLLNAAASVGYGYFHEENNEAGAVLLTTDFGMPIDLYRQPTLLAFFKKWFLHDASVYHYVKDNLAEDFEQSAYQYPQEILKYVKEWEMLEKLREKLRAENLI